MDEQLRTRLSDIVLMTVSALLIASAFLTALL
jgi:hypothetical protein